MLAKTEAIALRITPFSNTSHVVSWFTPQSGRISTLIKGAQRSKSYFLGHYDLFYTCEIVYYVRSASTLYILKECAPLKMRNGLRDSWAASVCASYLCDLIGRICPQDAPHLAIYHVLAQTLDALAGAGAQVDGALILWFELRMLAELGIAPQMTHCAICGKDMLYHRRAPTAFSFPHGGTLCEQCAPDEAKIAVRLTPDAVAILRAWQTAPSWRSALRSKSTRLQFQIVATALGLFLNYHLDTMPVSRKIALSLLNGESAIRATGKARGSLT